MLCRPWLRQKLNTVNDRTGPQRVSWHDISTNQKWALSLYFLMEHHGAERQYINRVEPALHPPWWNGIPCFDNSSEEQDENGSSLFILAVAISREDICGTLWACPSWSWPREGEDCTAPWNVATSFKRGQCHFKKDNLWHNAQRDLFPSLVSGLPREGGMGQSFSTKDNFFP